MIRWIIMVAFVCGCTIMDLKSRYINAGYCLFFLLSGIVINVTSDEYGWNEILFGIGIGVIFILGSILLNDAIGMGDAVIITIIGGYLGFTNTLRILSYAFLLLSIYSAGLLLVKKASKKEKIPAAPFMLLGECVTFIVYVMV